MSPTTTRVVFYVLTILVAVLAVIGDCFLAHWAKKSNKLVHLLAGFLLCNAALICFAQSLRFGTLLLVSILYDVLTTVSLMAVSRIYFKEAMPLPVYLFALGAIACVAGMKYYMPGE